MHTCKCVLALLSVFAIQCAGISSVRAEDWGYPDRIYHPNWTYFDWCKQRGGQYKKTINSYNGCVFQK